jgi:hypothetical protein
MLTTEQVRNRTKTVTRRMGWKFLKPGDVLNAVEKGMGLKKGEKIKKICQVRVVDVKLEALWLIDEVECVKEGFPEMTPAEFTEMFCKSHKHCSEDTIVTRIEFEYL